ncbi:hypothetical protein CVS40_10994 [Lucilia cuprina]|nr:hypothetical protein CVS40_10994 [Lucilia cuprina]
MESLQSVEPVVWVKEHHLSSAADSFAAKLAPKFAGPYRIHRLISPVIVEVRKDGEKSSRTAHVSELKVYSSPSAVNDVKKSSEL